MLYENYNAESAICQYYKKHYPPILRAMLLSMLILGCFGLLSILESYYGIPALQFWKIECSDTQLARGLANRPVPLYHFVTSPPHCGGVVPLTPEHQKGKINRGILSDDTRRCVCGNLQQRHIKHKTRTAIYATAIRVFNLSSNI